ncbi:hypothetical protein ACOJBM_38600 [Rhizobium beringeri]
MLGLVPPRRDAETEDAGEKPSSNAPVRGLEAERSRRSAAYK